MLTQDLIELLECVLNKYGHSEETKEKRLLTTALMLLNNLIIGPWVFSQKIVKQSKILSIILNLFPSDPLVKKYI